MSAGSRRLLNASIRRSLLAGVVGLATWCGAAGLRANADDTSAVWITIPFDVQVGEKFTITLTKEREVKNTDAAPKVSRGSVDITSEVIERSRDGYVFRWTYSRPLLAALDRQSLLMLMPIGPDDLGGRIVDGVLEFSSDATGAPIAVSNLKEIKHAARRVLDDVLAAVSRNTSSTASEAAIEHRRKRFQDRWAAFWDVPDQQLYDNLLDDASYLYVVTGGSFRLGEVERFQEERPGLYDGLPVPTETEFVMTRIDEMVHEATIELTSRFDEKRLREQAAFRFAQQMAEYAEMVGETERQMMREQLDRIPMSVADRVTITLDTISGQETKVVFERTMISGSATFVDRRIFTNQRVP